MGGQRRAYTEIGKRIAKLGRNQAELARVLGVAQQTVSKKLRGGVAIRLSDLEALAMHYGVPLGYFFENDGVSPDLAAAWERICGASADAGELMFLVSRLSDTDALRLLKIVELLTCTPSEISRTAAGPRGARSRRGRGRKR